MGTFLAIAAIGIIAIQVATPIHDEDALEDRLFAWAICGLVALFFMANFA